MRRFMRRNGANSKQGQEGSDDLGLDGTSRRPGMVPNEVEDRSVSSIQCDPSSLPVSSPTRTSQSHPQRVSTSDEFGSTGSGRLDARLSSSGRNDRVEAARSPVPRGPDLAQALGTFSQPMPYLSTQRSHFPAEQHISPTPPDRNRNRRGRVDVSTTSPVTGHLNLYQSVSTGTNFGSRVQSTASSPTAVTRSTHQMQSTAAFGGNEHQSAYSEVSHGQDTDGESGRTRIAVLAAKDHVQTLELTLRRENIDTESLRAMLGICQVDQQILQRKLSSALDDAASIDDLDGLFAVIDRLCAAIDAGKVALERSSSQPQRRRSADGPSIDLVVENEDVFSLIVMLRAPNDKKIGAAFALMNFAKESETLRNEIYSSGGMHAFLTLFRTKGSNDLLKVVASLAVAYILPSFVVSSELSVSVGLKVMECLRYLTMSNPVDGRSNGHSIGRVQMLKAASLGVNILWTNLVQPLLPTETIKSQTNTIEVPLQPRISSRLVGVRGKNAESQEDKEIRELTESSVVLITHIARTADSSSDHPLNVGHKIVELVCEVDVARPIAVREGLLKTLVEWTRSNDVDKVQPAVSALRYLVSVDDRYMAGWIHSQVISEGVVGDIMTLLNESAGRDTRIAAAEMLSALCVAPHTRTALVEANCVGFLVALLYEHSAPESETMVLFAVSALVQLAAGSVMRNASFSVNGPEMSMALPDKQDTVMSDILDGWAHDSLVQIALSHSGRLRSISVEALRILSEDASHMRQTRLQLCNVGAGKALGTMLKQEGWEIETLHNPNVSDADLCDPKSRLFLAVKGVYEALRGIANMLEPLKETSNSKSRRRSLDRPLIQREMLIKGCVDIVGSGALERVLRIVTLPYSSTLVTGGTWIVSLDKIDLIGETCRLLANLSPLLLAEEAASTGCAAWSSAVYDALHSVLTCDDGEHGEYAADLQVLHSDALRGLGALAHFEPLKTLILDKSLPRLLFLNNLDDQQEVSNAAGHVLLSLGFTDDEITVQEAGNDPKLLVDWFCLKRSLLLQAMARAELKSMLAEMWRLPIDDIGDKTILKLHQELCSTSEQTSSDTVRDSLHPRIFHNFTQDQDSHALRQSILEQYTHIYGVDASLLHVASSGSGDSNSRASREETGIHLLSAQTFPLNHPITEKQWILGHASAMDAAVQYESKICSVGIMPKRIQTLLDSCFPSSILRNNVVPVDDLRMQSSFDFRALMMPKRRYFSFSREGYLLVRLCEKQVPATEDIHWSLNFTDSTFSGEFAQSLVQTLYLCPLLSGLSFARSSEWLAQNKASGGNQADDEGLLVNLIGLLPPWVSCLTFDGILQDRDLRSLVAVLGSRKLLGPRGDGVPSSDNDTTSNMASHGNVEFIGIRCSPQIMQETWNSFFDLLGKTGPGKRSVASMPLSALAMLDLSGNEMGDELAAKVLELVHQKDSGCNVEQLDLSGNRIGRGTNVVRVLIAYAEYYRYDRKFGSPSSPSPLGWKSTLHTLVLADNDLFLGRCALEICALLRRDTLCLRFLDLSNNGLEGDPYQVLVSSILENTSLVHLNLSRNKFSPSLVDLLVDRINSPDAVSRLSFLSLEYNSPPITGRQRDEMGRFLGKSRKESILGQLRQEQSFMGEEFGTVINRDGLAMEHQESTLMNIPRDNWLPSGRRRSRTVPSTGPQLDFQDVGNMITVLFSAPLVFADAENTLHPFAKLDFDMERELLWQCMKEASRDIELFFDSAHHSRLLASIAKRCKCLHYSGHGHPHFLPFEDGMGGPNWLNVADIKELLVSGDEVPFKFVFVSACHSGLAGETFASAGVPHVVCCRQEKELKDTAALAFTRSFYLALAVGHTVRESFDQGCKAVRATPYLKDPENEMKKFVLLPRDGNHDVPVFRARPIPEWPKPTREMINEKDPEKGRFARRLSRGRSLAAFGARGSEIGTRNMMQEDPAPSVPPFFIGRDVDMFYLLTSLLKMKKRLVNVLGEPGVGRSSLVCGLCHYINERASTITEIDHIYFIKPKHGGRNVSCRSLVRQLLDKVKETGAYRSSAEDEADVESMLEVICRRLKNAKALIVFDRIELLEMSDDADDLTMILSTLLYDTKQVKVVLTGRGPLGHSSIGGQVEHRYELGPLNVTNSIRLFGHLCPHLHTPSERELFFVRLNKQCGKCIGLFPGDDQMGERARKVLNMVGGGIPAKIEKAAYSISKEAFVELRDFSS